VISEALIRLQLRLEYYRNQQFLLEQLLQLIIKRSYSSQGTFVGSRAGNLLDSPGLYVINCGPNALRALSLSQITTNVIILTSLFSVDQSRKNWQYMYRVLRPRVTLSGAAASSFFRMQKLMQQ
jgi:hypothetical protein